MDTACIIPARFNSSRFPGKLLYEIGGKTVIQRTFESAISCDLLKKVFVATDDKNIASHIEAIGGSVIWTSPSCKNGTERAIEAARKSCGLENSDCILILQGDHPCTSAKTISSVVKALSSNPSASMATAAVPLKNKIDFFSPHVVKCVFDQSGSALYFSRSPIPYGRGDLPRKAFQHVGIYAFRTGFLLNSLEGSLTYLQEEEDLEQLKILEMGHRIQIAVVEDGALGIDTPEDLDKLKKWIQSGHSLLNISHSE